MTTDETVQAIYDGMHDVTCVNHGPHCETHAAQIRDAIRIGLQRAGLAGQLPEQQRKRADQAEELLRIAHETSNRSEAERASAVRRAERAEAEAQRLRIDRAAVLLWAADQIAAQDPATAPLVGVHARGEDIALLRRLAVEAHDTGTQQPEAVALSTPCANCRHFRACHNEGSGECLMAAPLMTTCDCPAFTAPVAQQPAAEAWVCKCPAGLCGCGHHAPAAQQPAAADGEETSARPECANCWREIENRGTPSMSGPGHDNWVHVPGGFQPCFPQKPNSPRAEPRP